MECGSDGFVFNFSTPSLTHSLTHPLPVHHQVNGYDQRLGDEFAHDLVRLASDEAGRPRERQDAVALRPELRDHDAALAAAPPPGCESPLPPGA